MPINSEILCPNVRPGDSSENHEPYDKIVRHGRFEDVTICLIFGNTRKLGEIMVFYAVSSAEIFHMETRPSSRSSSIIKIRGDLTATPY